MGDNKLQAPFLDATKEVLNLMLDLNEITTGEGTGENPDDSGKIDVSIGVTGDYQGEVRYCFPNETSLEMVKIMSGMEVPEVDDFVISAVGEIANIISGKAMISLSEQDINSDILPPAINSEETKESAGLSEDKTRIVTKIGNIDMDIKIKEKE